MSSFKNLANRGRFCLEPLGKLRVRSEKSDSVVVKCFASDQREFLEIGIILEYPDNSKIQI